MYNPQSVLNYLLQKSCSLIHILVRWLAADALKYSWMIHWQSSSYRTMILLPPRHGFFTEGANGGKNVSPEVTISLFDRKMIDNVINSFNCILFDFEWKCFYFVFVCWWYFAPFPLYSTLFDLSWNNGNCYMAENQLIIEEYVLIAIYIILLICSLVSEVNMIKLG